MLVNKVDIRKKLCRFLFRWWLLSFNDEGRAMPQQRTWIKGSIPISLFSFCFCRRIHTIIIQSVWIHTQIFTDYLLFFLLPAHPTNWNPNQSHIASSCSVKSPHWMLLSIRRTSPSWPFSFQITWVVCAISGNLSSLSVQFFRNRVTKPKSLAVARFISLVGGIVWILSESISDLTLVVSIWVGCMELVINPTANLFYCFILPYQLVTDETVFTVNVPKLFPSIVNHNHNPMWEAVLPNCWFGC